MKGWLTSKTSRPCPICGGTGGVCVIHQDGHVALCYHIEAGCMTRCDGSKCQAKGQMGWFHAVGDNKGVKRERRTVSDEHLTATECKTMQKSLDSGLSPDRLAELAKILSLPEGSLRIYGLGFDPEMRLWTFPMYDGQRRICGFRTRDHDGNKRSLKGSRNGIFIPSDYDEQGGNLLDHLDDKPLLLLLPEGPTDAAAAHAIGYRAVGRPSNMGGVDQIKALLENGSRQDVIIVSDHDPTKWLKDDTPFVPGWEGSLHLADAILPVCASLKIVRPPSGVKDMRQWVNSGGEQSVFDRLAHDAELITRRGLMEKQKKLDAWKKSGRAQRQKERATPAGPATA